jgi:hypothetical protein
MAEGCEYKPGRRITKPSAELARGSASQPAHSTVSSESRKLRWLRRSPWVRVRESMVEGPLGRP